MIIAIDGPAASGKGTLGKRLAAHYGLRHLDTGLLYRAVAQAVLNAGHRLDDAAHAAAAAQSLDPAHFDLFRLVLAQRMTVAVVTSDGLALSVETKGLPRPLMLTSSSLGDAVVEAVFAAQHQVRASEALRPDRVRAGLEAKVQR